MSIFDLKDFLIKTCLTVLILMIFTGAVLHFYQLDKIPYGFHVDEMSGSVAVGCLATEGVDAHDIAHPLFADLHYGTPKPPTYLYPAIMWAKLFGYSAPSLRALSVTVHLLGILGLFFLAQSLFGWRYAVLTAVLASFSPWSWVLSRVAFESLFAATFLIWGLYVFLQPPRYRRMLLAGILMAGAMYSYPPFRLATPLMLLTLIIYAYKQYRLNWKFLTAFAIAFTITLIPLAQLTLNGALQQRFDKISIFSPDYLKSINASNDWSQLIKIFGHIYAMHLDPDFLFSHGDPSYVHSTRHFGILSWMDMAALAVSLIFLLMLLIKSGRKNNPLVKHPFWILFLLINIFIGIVPSALTNSEIPNSLRIMGSWPFMCLFSSFMLWQACELWWGLWLAVVLTVSLFAFCFLKIYFQVYPQEGKGMFSYWTLEEANQLKTEEDWLNFVLLYRHDDYNARYFLMQYKHLSCTDSRKLWENLRDYLISHGKY